MVAPAGADLTTAFRRLVISSDGDEWVLARPDLGIFVEIPAAGAAFIRAMQDGATVVEATAAASEAAGETVDGEDFVAELATSGLLDEADPGVAADAAAPGPRQRRIRWIEGVSQTAARRLFGPVAWAVYASAALLALSILAFRPELRPGAEDYWVFADPVLSLLVFIPVATIVTAGHEAWHWLAGRAEGVPAIFRVSYRGVFLVFETDLSQILTVPRRRRYGAFLAGMAFDVAVLGLALAVRLLGSLKIVLLPGFVDRLLALVVIVKIIGIVWQWAGVFLRTDAYAILANALRCNDLYRATWLTIRARLGRLGPRRSRLSEGEQRELADANPRDRSAAQWFGIVYVVGILGMTWAYLVLTLPALIELLSSSRGTWSPCPRHRSRSGSR